MESQPGETPDLQEFETRDELREFLDGLKERLQEEGESLPREISTGIARNRETGRYVVSLMVQEGFDASEFKDRYFGGLAIDEVPSGQQKALDEDVPATAF